MSLESALDGQIVICAGPGGVGKTTISAAIALEGALRGRETVVVTIDPAKRLADALGLEELSNEPRRVPPEKFAEWGLPACPLDAMMLDTKTTFDDLVHRYAKSEEKAKGIIENGFYQAISGALSGTHEYMAMEKLYELHQRRAYDVIVLDTPPTKHALDFLMAPSRMTNVLDKSVLDVLMRPFDRAGRLSLGLLARAAKKVAKKIDDVVGLQFVHDLSEFFQAFEGMYDGFRDRAKKVNELLREKVTAFVVVAAPLTIPLREAEFFLEKLRELEMPVAALVLNRVQESVLPPDAQASVHAVVRGGAAARARALDAAKGAVSGRNGLLAKAVESLLREEHLALADRARIEALVRQRAQGLIVREIPRFGGDVHDLSGLRRMNEHLFGGDTP